INPATRAKAGYRRRLLIIDRHSSYINMEFIRAYNRLKILLLILPPYSTYRLYPLNISYFLLLAICYITKINKIMEKSGDIITITKRMFWDAFKPV
ncbi:uncharacterized protein K444DRAFT_520690, partial [Hyaloscypha bicolor E]